MLGFSPGTLCFHLTLALIREVRLQPVVGILTIALKHFNTDLTQK